MSGGTVAVDGIGPAFERAANIYEFEDVTSSKPLPAKAGRLEPGSSRVSLCMMMTSSARPASRKALAVVGPPSTRRRVMPSAARRDRTRRRLRLPEVEAPTSKILTPGRPARPPHFEESPQTIQTGGFWLLKQPRLRQNVAARRKHHADRRAVFEAGQPAGQLRIVGFDRFSANEDRIGPRPEQVGLRPRRLARDPNGLTAGASRYAAIRVNRELDLNERPPLRDAKGVPQIEPVRLFGEFAAQDLYAVRFQAKPSRARPRACPGRASRRQPLQRRPRPRNARMVASRRNGCRAQAW